MLDTGTGSDMCTDVDADTGTNTDTGSSPCCKDCSPSLERACWSGDPHASMLDPREDSGSAHSFTCLQEGVLRWCDAPDALAVASLSEQSHEEPQASERADVGRCCPRGPKGLRSVADPSPDPPQTRPLSLTGAQTDPWL